MKKRPASEPPAPPPAHTTPEQPQRPVDDWVDDRDLAARTPITRVGWQTWRMRGQGPPYYKIGKRCLYKWSEVAAWMQAQQIAPKSTSTVVPRRASKRSIPKAS